MTTIGVFSRRCGLLQSIYKWHVKIICNLPFAATSSLEIRILQRPVVTWCYVSYQLSFVLRDCWLIRGLANSLARAPFGDRSNLSALSGVVLVLRVSTFFHASPSKKSDEDLS